jgi:UDP-glucose 4-epimerase
VIECGRRTAIERLSVEALRTTAADVDWIVHCAGGSAVSRSFTDPLGDFDDTVASFAQILELARTRSPAPRVVLVSSAAVYGHVRELPIREDAACSPQSPYGVHKRLAEDLARAAARFHEVPVGIVRLFSLYGPGLRKQLLWDACRKITNGDRRFAGSGQEQRDWLHVTDACRLVALAAERASTTAPVWNGGSGKGVAVADVLRELFRHLGESGEPQFDGSARAGDPQHYVADIERARALGWRPTIELSAGLGEYARWFRQTA